jgi:hypothetical protein
VLTVAQHVLGDDTEAIDVFFQQARSLPKTSILRADAALTPPELLIETAEYVPCSRGD